MIARNRWATMPWFSFEAWAASCSRAFASDFLFSSSFSSASAASIAWVLPTAMRDCSSKSATNDGSIDASAAAPSPSPFADNGRAFCM